MPTGVFTILGFVAHLHAVERDLEVVGPAIVARACEMLCREIKEVLGSYHYGWQHLQPETIAKKMLGDTPLFETGALRDSIEWNSEGLVGHVGTNLDRAEWMEFGTSRGVPPRPFIVPTAMAMEARIQKMASRAVRAILRGEGLHSSELGELIHLLRHAGHALKETADKLLEPDDDKDGKRR